MGVPDDNMGFAHVINSQGEHHMVLIYKASDQDESVILDNQHPEVRPASQRPDLTAVYVFQNDGTIFTIKDEGNAQRSLKETLKGKNIKKWTTAKERSRENTESFIPFNNGKPLAPDWLSDHK